jgi:hypothetical protein
MENQSPGNSGRHEECCSSPGSPCTAVNGRPFRVDSVMFLTWTWIYISLYWSLQCLSCK